MKCRYLKLDGSACKANAMKDSDFCWMHSPHIDEIEKQHSRYRGGVNRHIPEKTELPEVVLKNLNDIPPMLVDTIQHLRRGAIDVRLGTAIGYLSNVLMKSYELTDLEPRIEKVEQYIKENLEGEIPDDYKVT